MNYQLITDADVQEYYRFCLHHAQHLARVLPDELWHYTDATGLIAILESKKIWATQVTCLNDTLEQRYCGDLVHAAVKDRRKVNTDPVIEPLFRAADELLGERDFTTVGQFVACFSEAKDDLGQWRGYGGGECGYALGFSSKGIMSAINRRPNTLLMPMIYADSSHSFVVADVIRMSEIYYRQGLSRGDPDQWAREFVMAFADALGIGSERKAPKIFGRGRAPDCHTVADWRTPATGVPAEAYFACSAPASRPHRRRRWYETSTYYTHLRRAGACAESIKD